MRIKKEYFYLFGGVVAMSFQMPTRTADGRGPEVATVLSTNDFVGYAYGENSQQLLYKEESTQTLEGERPAETVTRYFDPAHQLFASRTLKFSGTGYTPDFKTEDFRTGYMEGASVVAGKIRLFVRENKDAPLREKTFSPSGPSVIDGGFNQFVKDQWGDILQGHSVVFNFMVPSRLDYYAFRVTKVSATSTELVVRIEPNSMFIRMLAPPIVVHYDLVSKRIRSYEGKSNIVDAKGSNLTVRLIYPNEGP